MKSSSFGTPAAHGLLVSLQIDIPISRLAFLMILATQIRFTYSRNIIRLGLMLLIFPSSGWGQDQPLDTIAFGSCAREREEQPVWDQIVRQDPDLFLMIGDNHYADFWMKDGEMVMLPVPNIERIEEAYDELGRKPGFRKIRELCPIMATWDDHDYGANDMGNDFALRRESQTAFLDFFGFPANDPLRQQEGIYHARRFGPAGRRVQIIMLDTRYHRDPIETRSPRVPGKGPYRATVDVQKTMLGENQWRWLQQQLQMEADIRIIASSVQVVAYEHGWETWGNLPHERERLYRLIDQTNANGVVIVSGDRHLIEISRDDHPDAPYPIWDFTSSGLTQKTEPISEQNRFRIGPVCRQTNFGVVRLQWDDEPSRTMIHLEGYGESGQLLTRQTLFLAELQQR